MSHSSALIQEDSIASVSPGLSPTESDDLAPMESPINFSEETQEHAQEPSPSLSDLNATASADIYSPLQPGQTRLITLHHGSPSDIVRCTVSPVSLQDEPEFEALSYVWGSEADWHEIFLNYQPFKVTSNLATALLHLRSPTTDRVIWVDALAINQSDIPERNVQVQWMKDIYVQAKRVLLCVGPEEENSNLWLDFVSEAKSQGFAHTWLEQWLETTNDELEPVMLSLGHLLMRDYWFRVWVAQELAYGRDVTVICGPRVIPYVDLLAGIEMIVQSQVFNERVASLSGPSSPLWMLINHYGPHCLPRPGSASREDYLTTVDWLRFITNKKCKDSRDYVYAFHSCWSPEIRVHIKVNYNEHLHEVFRSAAEAMIKVTGNLDLICWRKTGLWMWELEKVPERLPPTWVPNYASAVLYHSLVDLAVKFPHVAGSSSAFAQFLEDDSILHVKGVCVGLVLKSTAPPWNPWGPWEPFQAGGVEKDSGESVLEWLIKQLYISRRKLDIPETSERGMTAFARTMLVGQRQTLTPILEIFQILISFRGFLISEQEALLWSEDFVFSWAQKVHEKRAMFSFLPEPRLLAAAKGEENDNTFLGLGPRTVQHGDKVCVLFGCTTGVILREVSDYHVVVGEAYINGFMDGEAVAGVEAGIDEPEDFFLK